MWGTRCANPSSRLPLRVGDRRRHRRRIAGLDPHVDNRDAAGLDRRDRLGECRAKLFHVLNRGVGRMQLFRKDDDFEALR